MFSYVTLNRMSSCDLSLRASSCDPHIVTWTRIKINKKLCTQETHKKILKPWRKFRVHSLGKHRQQLASCATLWRLFPTRDREHELSFLLLFVFSLRKRKERKKWKKRLRLQRAREKLSVGKWNCERFYYVFVAVSCTQFSQAPQCTQISSFPKTFLSLRLRFVLKWKGARALSFILHGRQRHFVIVDDKLSQPWKRRWMWKL